jgi:hypothetical protein
MDRRITLSIALALSIVLISLMTSDSTANAQPPQRFRFATGVIKPGLGQTLRVFVAAGDVYGDNVRVRFHWTRYMAAGCSGMPAVCRHTVASQGSTPVTTLGNDALSFEIDAASNGDLNTAIEVESNRKDVQVNAMIIDSATGEIVTSWATFPSS